MYATWATFKDIFNVQRSHLPLQVGWDLPYHGQLTPRQELLNEAVPAPPRGWTMRMSTNAFQQIPLLDSFADHQPRLLFVGYGETDNWGHAGRYDLVLHSAHVFDHFVEQLWDTLQRLPAYRDQTTFIITTDHGRGSGPVEWKEHGVEEKGSENIWIAVMQPGHCRAQRAHLAHHGSTPGADRRDGGGAARQGLPPDGAGCRRADRRSVARKVSSAIDALEDAR